MGSDRLRRLACAQIVGLLASATLAGCWIEEPGSTPVGAVQMALEIAPGVDIDEVQYSITVGQAQPLSGTIPVGEDATAPIHKMVPDVPAGTAQVALSGVARNGGTGCDGSGAVRVDARRTSRLSILLHCRSRKGNIDINGRFNNCPRADFAGCASSRTTVGESLAVSGSASDPDGDALMLRWTATSGTFDDPGAASTNYRCTMAGTHTLSFSADDGRGCTDARMLTIVCEPAPVDAGNHQPVCGNGMVEEGEQCDDGNVANDDGCSSTCMDEPEGPRLCTGNPGTPCEECVCRECTQQVAACEGLVGDAQAGPRAGTSRRELCVGLAFCMLSTACRGLQCLCGTVASGNCISSGVGNGQCRNQVLAAGESNIFGTVAVRTIDPNLALNRAFAVGTCASSAACTDVCDPGP